MAIFYICEVLIEKNYFHKQKAVEVNSRENFHDFEMMLIAGDFTLLCL
jgi:hypothetical protein